MKLHDFPKVLTQFKAVIYTFEELRESEQCIKNMKSNLSERVKAMNWQCGRAGKIPRGKRRLARMAESTNGDDGTVSDLR